MEAGETHLDMLAKPNPSVCVGGGGEREKGKQGGEKMVLGLGGWSGQRAHSDTWCLLGGIAS